MGDEGNAAGADGFEAAVLRGADEDIVGLCGEDGLHVEVALLADADGTSVAHLLLHGGREEVLQRIHAHDAVFQPKHLEVAQLEGCGTDKASEGTGDDHLLRSSIGCGRVGVADDDVDAVVAVIDLQPAGIAYRDGVAEVVGMGKHRVVGRKQRVSRGGSPAGPLPRTRQGNQQDHRTKCRRSDYGKASAPHKLICL